MAHHVYFRTDADKLIGTGHFFRCLFIARELKKRGIASTFFMAHYGKNILKIISDEDFDFEGIPLDLAFDASYLAGRLAILKKGKSLLVIDHPNHSFYNTNFQTQIRTNDVGLMMITFRSGNHFHADIVHNQNLLALEEKYSTESYTKLLLGPQYVILDEKYSSLRLGGKRCVWPVKTILIFFGGADNTNLTFKTLAAINKLKEKPFRVMAVIGPLYERLAELRKYIASLKLNVELNINTVKMPELMAGTDLAITSGGLTTWELACLGVPNLIISTSEREKIHTPLLAKKGACIYLGHFDEVSEKIISEAVRRLMVNKDQFNILAGAGMRLVDGKGTDRVVDQMNAVMGV